jgi:arylsulfatase A-like enzyme
MFVHFGDVDAAGHSLGWASSEQMAAIARADAAVGMVLTALKIKKLYQPTVIILSADHGGTGHWHGPNDPRARTIPWIALGPGIKANNDLSTSRDLSINTEDTFATVCALLGIPVPAGIDGKPVWQILQPPAVAASAAIHVQAAAAPPAAKN